MDILSISGKLIHLNDLVLLSYVLYGPRILLLTILSIKSHVEAYLRIMSLGFSLTANFSILMLSKSRLRHLKIASFHLCQTKHEGFV